MTPTITAQVLDELRDVSNLVSTIIAQDKERDKKVDAMYTILVTGRNGTPSLPETVRKHQQWIDEQQTRAKRQIETGRAIVMLFIGQAVSFIWLALSVWLGLKK